MTWQHRLIAIFHQHVEKANDAEAIYRFCNLLTNTNDSFVVFAMQHHNQAMKLLRVITDDEDAALFMSLFQQHTATYVAQAVDPVLLENPIMSKYMASTEFANQQRFQIQASKLDALHLVSLLQRYSEPLNDTITHQLPWSRVPLQESILDLYLIHTPFYENHIYYIKLVLAGEYNGSESAVMMRKIKP